MAFFTPEIVEQARSIKFTDSVDVSTPDPNTLGAVFVPNNPAQPGVIYIADQGSVWQWDGAAYVPYTGDPIPVLGPWKVAGSGSPGISPGNNPNVDIQREDGTFTKVYDLSVRGQYNVSYRFITAASTNVYNDVGYPVFTGTAPQVLNGMARRSDVNTLSWVANFGTGNLTINHNSAAVGNTQNRFYLPSDVALVLAPGQTATFMWTVLHLATPPGTTGWRLLSVSQRTGGDSNPLSYDVTTATAHGFVVGDAIRATPTGYAKAQANSRANSDGYVGIVITVFNTTNFKVGLPGSRYGTGFTGGTLYYLSAATAGALVTTAPTTPNIITPLGVGLPTGELLLLQYQGIAA
ncbi:MAG: hypothetical protein ACRC62_07045 [Microcoleus sp.]